MKSRRSTVVESVDPSRRRLVMKRSFLVREQPKFTVVQCERQGQIAVLLVNCKLTRSYKPMWESLANRGEVCPEKRSRKSPSLVDSIVLFRKRRSSCHVNARRQNAVCLAKRVPKLTVFNANNECQVTVL